MQKNHIQGKKILMPLELPWLPKSKGTKGENAQAVGLTDISPLLLNSDRESTDRPSVEIPHTPCVSKALGGGNGKDRIAFPPKPSLSRVIIHFVGNDHHLLSTMCPKLFNPLQIHYLITNAQNEQNSCVHFTNGQLYVKKWLSNLSELTHGKWWSQDFCPEIRPRNLCTLPFRRQD